MSNLTDALKVRYPEEIPTIRALHPILLRFSDLEIDRLWRAFSVERSAGWLMLDGSSLTEFKRWIEE